MTHRLSPLSRRHRIPAALTGILLFLSGSLTAAAQQTHYTDVPAGAYYEESASALIELGALDSSESRLRPSDRATRAELVKLLVHLNDEPLLHPSQGSFNDVARSAWYFPYFEAAASVGWIHGDNNCHTNDTRPCTARPGEGVNRAEAATLLVRAFALARTGTSMQFTDNPRDAWYFQAIQTAADHCILQGDDNTGLVRPGALMNRAEMVVMFHRATQHLQYGEDCGVPLPRISTVTPVSTTVVQVRFTADVNTDRATDESRYTVFPATNASATIDIDSAVMRDRRTVELTLSEAVSTNTQYSVDIRNMTSLEGTIFSDVAPFTVQESAAAGHVTSVTALSPTRLRVVFDADVDAGLATGTRQYSVIPVGSTGSTAIAIGTVSRVDARTVLIDLSNSLTASTLYRLTAHNLRTTGGTYFTGSQAFTSMPAQGGHMTDATAQSSTRINLTFDADLDRARAEQTNRYSVTADGRSLQIRTADLTSARNVTLELAEAMDSQRSYVVNAMNLLTSAAVNFTDSRTIVNGSGSVSLFVTLGGGDMVPPIVTTAAGSGTFVLTANGLQYDIAVKNMTGSLVGEFHIGDAGAVGPTGGTVTFTGNRATGVWTNLTTEQRNAILNGRVYFLVTSPRNVSGEVRGQLRR